MQALKRQVILLLLFCCFFISVKLFSSVHSYVENRSEKGFVENKGQMMDMNGSPVPHVLFKTEAPELNFWITEKGITIQTLSVRKDAVSENELSEFEKEQAKMNGKVKTKKYFDWERIDVELKGATIKKENIVKENPLQGHFNYFYAHCPEGIYEVHEYEKITIKNVHSGIDWVFYRKADGTLKYDFIVHPGADYRQIELLYKSKTPLSINKSGEIELTTSYGNVKENTPVSFYQGKEITTRFKLKQQKEIIINEDRGYETSIQFELPNPELRTPNSPLIIDPQLTWGTFYGGSGLDGFTSMDTDDWGNVFITGYVNSTDFPTFDPGSGAYFWGFSGGTGGDVFILKFSNTNALLWATYYGGSAGDYGNGICTDASGSVFVTGYTSSSDLPTFDPGGGVTYFQGTYGGGSDAFILKFSNTGTRLWATYYGGSSKDNGNNICTDISGNVFVTGHFVSTDFPTLNPGSGAYFLGNKGVFDTDAFILKFNNTGTLLWATFYGGTDNELGHDICTDASGNVFVVGNTSSTNLPPFNPGAGAYFQGNYGGNWDVFILKFSNTGALLWGTYYGGSSYDSGLNIRADAGGDVFVTGWTTSLTNFPILNPGGNTYFQGTGAGGADAFILKFSNTGTRLWATYYGGSLNEVIPHISYQNQNIAIDNCNNVYIAFQTASTDCPVQSYQASCGGFNDNSLGGSSDQFIIKFSNAGERIWASYVGGNGGDLRALVTCYNDILYLAGEWTQVKGNASYPRLNPGSGAYYDGTFNGGLDDSFIMKFLPIQAVYQQSQINPGACACNGEAVISVTCGEAPYSYQWSNAVSVFNTNSSTHSVTGLCAGIYQVTVTSGCSGSDSVYTFNLTGNLAISTHTISAYACGSYTHNAQTYTASGVYTQTLTDAIGCDSLLTINLIIENVQNTSSFVSVCPGHTVQIHGISQATAGVYTQTFVSANGCDSVSTVTLLLHPSPIASFQINPNPAQSQIPVQFTDMSIQATSWHWSFGDKLNSFSTQQHPVFTYDEDGSYRIQLAIENQYGCKDTIGELLTVEQGFELYTPNTFTPNADGVNDKFLPVISGIEINNFVLYVFDRWGDLIFESRNPSVGWDGRANGGKNIAQVDTYVWKLKLTDISGKKYQYLGHINLLK